MNNLEGSGVLQEEYEYLFAVIKGKQAAPIISDDHGRRLDHAVTEIQSKLRWWISWHIEGVETNPAEMENLVTKSFEQFIDHCLWSEESKSCDSILAGISEQICRGLPNKSTSPFEIRNPALSSLIATERDYEFLFECLNQHPPLAELGEGQSVQFDQAVFRVRATLENAITTRQYEVPQTPEQIARVVTVALEIFVKECPTSSDARYWRAQLDRVVERAISECPGNPPQCKTSQTDSKRRTTTLQEDYNFASACLNGGESYLKDAASRRRFDEAILAIQINLQFGIRHHISGCPHTPEECERLGSTAIRKFLNLCLASPKASDCSALLDGISERVVAEYLSERDEREEPTTLQQDCEYIASILADRFMFANDEVRTRRRVDRAIEAIRTHLRFGVTWFAEISGTVANREHLVAVALDRFLERCRTLGTIVHCDALLDQIARAVVADSSSTQLAMRSDIVSSIIGSYRATQRAQVERDEATRCQANTAKFLNVEHSAP